MSRPAGAATIALALLAGACGAPEYGELPARCADGRCPEGFACIHGVCAAPGTAVPITVARVHYLRGLDLKLIPQSSGVLVTWQTYAYSPGGEAFVGARVTPDGAVSPTMGLVTSFVANEGTVEPYYDVLALSDQDLLLSVSASPLPGDASPSARLLTYRVRLPPKGQEAAGPRFEAAWSGEARLETVGYGAVSRPKLLARGDRVELGYVRSRTDTSGAAPKIVGELAVFPLDLDGARRGEPAIYPARDGLTVAVGVLSAFARGGAAWWVLDDVRPSALLLPDAGDAGVVPLERLAVAIDAGPSSLFYVDPSARTGDKLPTDPVSGDAWLRRVDASPAQGGAAWSFDDAALGGLPTVRDAPRPAWIARGQGNDGDRPALLVTPGADVDAPALSVYTVDPAGGGAALATRIERLSSAPVGAIEAAVVGGKLYVAWLDVAEDASMIRMAVVPEP